MYKQLNTIHRDIRQKDHRYHPDAYDFMMEALSFAQKKFQRSRHVSGKELLEATKILLMKKYGPMTITLLRHWGIHRTEDFGNIVFNLVERKVLSKTEEDDIATFKNVFDFDTVFNKGYRSGLAKRISRMR
jgi:uncharacterized repeat protein (TIGR04138 family)